MDRTVDAASLAAEVDAILSTPNAPAVDRATHALSLLTALEAATPGGAPLHHQIDVVRRWVGVLQNEADHERFGGTAHLRDYLAAQLRLLHAAVADYLREGQ